MPSTAVMYCCSRVSSWPGAACGAAWPLDVGAAGAGVGAVGAVPKSRCGGSVKPRFTGGAGCELERVAAAVAAAAAAAGRGGSTRPPAVTGGRARTGWECCWSAGSAGSAAGERVAEGVKWAGVGVGVGVVLALWDGLRGSSGSIAVERFVIHERILVYYNENAGDADMLCCGSFVSCLVSEWEGKSSSRRNPPLLYTRKPRSTCHLHMTQPCPAPSSSGSP
jgi:hypothetical protein